jgi:hypothetical protein
MSTNQASRPRFYEGQYLGADDLTTVVDYGRIEDARHMLGAHTWGIAAGLQLTEKPAPAGGTQVDVIIQPGYAWDGFGRPIVVLSPTRVPAELFKSIEFESALDGGTPPGRLFKIWLRYDESATRQAPQGFTVCGADEFSRIGETFRIEIGEFAGHSSHASISVAGYSIDAQETLQKLDPQTQPVALYDESIPFQDFPNDKPTTRWLIPLGEVRWLPNAAANQPGNFVKREAADLTHSHSLRRYIGVVAGAVEAADGVVRIHNRTNDYSPVASTDLLWVEGSLRVEGDARLFEGKLDFRDKNGSDAGVPLSIQRTVVSAAGVTNTRIETVIGQDNHGLNAFAVGRLDPASGNKFDPKLIVRDDGKTGLGTETPNQALTIQGSGATFLNVKANAGAQEILIGADGAGGIVSTMTNDDLILRSGRNNDRVTIKANGDVGIGTSAPLNSLHVARAGHLNAIFDNTDTSRHLTAVVGSVGSGLRLSDSNFFFIGKEPYASRNSTNTGTELLRITTAGDVGIGTTAPADKLEVSGNLRIMSALNPIRFTSDWSDFPAGDSRNAEICNDTRLYKTLMIVGNRSNNGGVRRVSVWDRLEVNGSLTTTHLEVNGLLVTEKLQLGGKWLMSGVGDAQGNDDWLRLFNTGNTGYFGGFAAGKIYSDSGAFDSSDLRRKKEIVPLDNALAGLLALRGMRFKWRDSPDDRRHIGLLAQDVEAVFPELVEIGPNGMKAINTSGLFGPLVEAVKQQHRELTELRAKIAKLAKRPHGAKKNARRATAQEQKDERAT